MFRVKKGYHRKMFDLIKKIIGRENGKAQRKPGRVNHIRFFKI